MPSDQRAEHRNWLFGALCLVQIAINLDAWGLIIALPTLQRELGLSVTEGQWVAACYPLAFGALLPLVGRISDAIGARRTLVVGAIGYATADLIAGCAVNGPMLIAARSVEGCFGAAMIPAAQAILIASFPLQRDRNRAFGTYAATGAFGAALGVCLGGVFTDFASWRLCSFLSAPTCIAIAVGSALWAPRGHIVRRAGLRVASTVTMTSGLLALVYGISRAGEVGWSDRWTVVLLAGGTSFCLVFGVAQSRVVEPLLPLSIFRDRDRAGAMIALFATGAATVGYSVFLNFYMESVLGYSVLQAGLAYVPYLLIQTAVNAIVPRLALGTIGPRVLIAAGMGLNGVALLLLTRLNSTTDFATGILPALLLIGVGQGLFYSVAANVMAMNVATADVGIANGVGTAMGQVGGSIGVALLGTIAASVHPAHTALDALARGYTAAFWGSVAIYAIGALVAAATVRPGVLRPRIEEPFIEAV